MKADRPLYDQACEELDRAMATTNGLERIALIEKAVRLHRLAVEKPDSTKILHDSCKAA
jgi:hypothetical protein